MLLILLSSFLLSKISVADVGVCSKNNINTNLIKKSESIVKTKYVGAYSKEALALLKASAGNKIIAKATDATELRGNVYLLSFIAWLYFMSVSINIPNMPRYIQMVVNKGDDTVKSFGSLVYGRLTGIDSFFTFMSVNAVGCLSDSYGRRPFIALSSLGLGLSYYISSIAKDPRTFYLSGFIDGMTSSMFSQSQAYLLDCVPSNRSSVAINQFQGLVIGMTFTFGIPIGAALSKLSVKLPLYVAVALCSLSALLSALFLAEPNVTSEGKRKVPKPFRLSEANPVGALDILSASKVTLGASIAYLLLNFAQTGLQVIWFNYLKIRFNWTQQQSGMTFVLLGTVRSLE